MLQYNGFIEFVAEHCVLHLLPRHSHTSILRNEHLGDGVKKGHLPLAGTGLIKNNSLFIANLLKLV